MNGTRLEENNFLIDGILNNENHNGLGILIFPIIGAIEEFRVEQSVANAQFGRGGAINLTYKSGGKDYHGGLCRISAKLRPGREEPGWKGPK